MINSVQLTEILRQWVDVLSTRSMHAWTRYVKATGLSMQQFGILMNLNYRHTCGVSDIGERMDISAAAASQLVEKLVQSGLVQRAEDPNDRRAKLLTLSDKGQNLIKSGFEARSIWVDDFIAELSPEEFETVAAALGSLTRAAKRLEFKRTEKTVRNLTPE